MAPEVVQKHYTLSADLWSTGILAYLLLTGRLPFAKGQRQSSELYATKQVGGMTMRSACCCCCCCCLCAGACTALLQKADVWSCRVLLYGGLGCLHVLVARLTKEA